VFARNAALRDLDLTELTTTVTGDWDAKGLFEIDDATSAFRNITVETRVKTTGSVEEAVHVARLTHRRCPIHATLRKSTNLVFNLYVNGVEVRRGVPE
jgi:uncharacterized OsmC-like protein